MIAFILMYLFMGAIAGILAGLLGLGGGIVMIPMLNLAFALQHLPPEIAHKLALGTSMACIVFTSISSSHAHNKRGGVIWKTVLGISPGIILGTFCGSFVATRLPASALQIFFAFFLCYVSYSMFANKKPKPTRQLPGIAGLSAVGSIIGLISSLVGIGGGTMSVPYLIWNNVEMKKAIGTSAAIGFPIALSGAIGYIYNGWNLPNLPDYSIGLIYLPALIPMLCMSTLFAPLGAKWTQILPVPTLKKFFAALLALIAIKMFVSAI